MIQIQLSEDEKCLLKEYFKTSPLKLIRLKAQAVLMREKELKVSDMEDLLSKDARSIQRWLKDFSDRRMASIFSGHHANENASKLTKEQKEEIKGALAQPPSEYAIPKEFWDIPSLKRYVQVNFKIMYESVQSYYFLLKFSNLSFKLPDKFDFHRDDHFINQRIKEIRKEIKPLLEDPTWEVFSSDEVRIQLEALTRRAWLKKGEKTIIKVQKSNEYQNYLGLLNQKSQKCHLYELAWQNQITIIQALEKFLKKYPDKKICIIWDNAAFHKGAEMRKALGQGQLLERVHLINLPPYAPDKNPIEHVWKEAKEKIANIQFEDFEKTKNQFRKLVTARKFAYQI